MAYEVVMAYEMPRQAYGSVIRNILHGVKLAQSPKRLATLMLETCDATYA
jgi:hypothetical protein